MTPSPFARLLLVLPLLAAGCARPAPPDAAAALEDALASHQASLAAIPGRPAPAGGTGRPRAAAPAGAAAAGPAAAVPAASVPTMAGQLVGQVPETVRQWLGEPRLRRDEGAAQVWHYQAAECHLDVILYREDGPPPVWRVAFAQARAVGAARRGEAACLRDISRGAARPLPGAPTRLAGPLA